MNAILITGASSGIGAALAGHYAAPGVTLFLSGRNLERLGHVAEACRAKGAEVHAATLDVTDAAATAAWVNACDGVRALDLVIANAGISAGTGSGGEAGEQTREIFRVNLDGTINTVLPAIDLMRPRRQGRIALMSSLAGFRGMPGAPAYTASKAAVRVWGEGLRGWLGRDGITVSIICPGFVTTPMTDVNRFPMPFKMDAARAARIIARGLASGRERIAFPFPFYALSWLMGVLPPSVADWVGRRLPAKS